MKKITFIILCLITLNISAQYAPTFTTGYDPNFISVNKSNFSPTSGTTTYNDQQKYLSTLLNLPIKIHANLMSLNGLLTDANVASYSTLALLDATPAYSYNRIVRANGIIARKVMYARNHISGNADRYVRMLIVRPDDNIIRPCVMITNGVGNMNQFGTGSIYYQVMTDIALRGYTVVFFESISNDLSYIATNIAPTGSYPCNYNPNTSVNVEKNAYANFQYGVAAYNYILSDANLTLANRVINANVNDIHVLGISMGAATSFMLGYSRNNINYTNYMKDFYYSTSCASSLTNNNFTKLCLNSNPTTNLNLRSVTGGSGILPANGGDYFSTINNTPSRTIPTLLIYGINDFVKYDIQDAGNSTGPLPAISLDSIRRTLKLQNKPNKLIVNCVGGHGFTRDISPIAPNENLSLNNTQQINSVTYPGFIEFNNINDNESKYTSFSLDGICFRKFSTEMAYNISQRTNLVTILTNFWRDVRTNVTNNNPGPYYNNTPQYITTPLSYSCAPCFIIPNRCASANLDGNMANSAACPIPTNREPSRNTQFTRLAKPNTNEDKNEIKDEFLVYPNPANNNLTIRYAANSEKNVFIKIYDNLGKLAYNSNNKLNIGDNDIQIQTINLADGMYILSIENELEIYTDKILINHK